MFHADRLRKWRKKRGLTMAGLAAKINTSKGTISNYENGHSTPPNESLVALADALNVTTDYLLGRTNNPQALLETHQRNFIDKLDLDGDELLNMPVYSDGRELSTEEKKRAIRILRATVDPNQK